MRRRGLYTGSMNTTFPSPKSIPKYLATMLLFYFAARARLPEMPFGFAAGLYAGLVYSRGYVWLLAPMYIAGCLLADCSIGGIVYAALPVLVLTTVRLVYDKLARPLKAWEVQLYHAAVIAVVAVVQAILVHPVWSAVTTVLSIAFAYFATIVCYGVLVRGVRHRLSADEKVGGIVLLAILGWGLYRVQWGGFRPYWIVLAAAIVYGVLHMPAAGAILLSFGVALGGAIATKDLSVAGGAVAICLIGAPFVRLPKGGMWLTLAAILLADVLVGIYFGCFGGYDWKHPLAFGIGILCYAVLPKRAREKLPDYRPTDGTIGARNWMSHTKRDLSERLLLVSRVFYEMADAYGSCSGIVPEPDRALAPLAQELASKTCVNCERRAECMQALGGQTASVMESIVDSALRTGRAMLDDVPNFLHARCIRIPALLANCNSLVAAYHARRESGQAFDRDRAMMSAQLAGVGSVLGEFACDVEGAVSVDRALADRMSEELRYHNVVCSEVTVIAKQQAQEIFLVVRTQDAAKPSVRETAQQVLGVRLIECEAARALSADRVCVHYATAPKFDMTFGSSQFTKPGSDASGDSVSVTRMRANRSLVGICDGMGSGAQAEQSSRATLDMICNFYKAGLDNARSIALVNRLLVDMGQERFSALDLCVVDLDNATVDFVKLGGVMSFIRRDTDVQIIPSQALPIGIVEEARPQVRRELLQPGDMVVLVSDGIVDALTEDGVKLIVDQIGTLNPQTLADELLRQAERKGLQDDASAVAFRIFPFV